MVSWRILRKVIPLFDDLLSLIKNTENQVYLVGGVLRDIYLINNGWLKDKPLNSLVDFDFMVIGDPHYIARKFSYIVHSKVITLDEATHSYRVVLKKEGVYYNYDFIAIKGKDIYEDVYNRDIIINTLLLNINDYPNSKILDLLGAKKDLDKRIINIIGPHSIKDDPLRILRVFSLAGRLNFKISKQTIAYVIQYKKLLKKVSSERTNEEIFKLLSLNNSYRWFKELLDKEVLDEVIPYITSMRGVQQGNYHHLDVYRHSLETLYRLELLYKRRLSLDKEITDYLNEIISSQHTRLHILKLSALLHDIGKPFAFKIKDKKTIFHKHEEIGARLSQKIAQKLCLSNEEKKVLYNHIFWHLRPGYLADLTIPTQRSIYRFFRDLKEEAPAIIILSISDWRATRGVMVDTEKRLKHERVMFRLLKMYFENQKLKPLPKLIDGYDVMKKFSLSPSPLVGKILEAVCEAQSLGKISTKEEAFMVAKKVLQRYNNIKSITKKE